MEGPTKYTPSHGLGARWRWAFPLGTMCSHVSSRQQTSPQFVVKSVCKPRMGASCGSLLGLPWTSWGSPGASWVPPVANIGNNLFPRVHPPQQTSLQIAVTSGLQRMPMVSPGTCPRKRKSTIFSWTSGLPLVVVTSQRTQIASSAQSIASSPPSPPEDANCVHIKLTVSKGRKGNAVLFPARGLLG